MKFVTLADGTEVPALGLGTWRIGENDRARSKEVDAVLSAVQMGYRLIDTAEMYGEGGAETVVGTAVAEALASRLVRRDELFIVSKVYPHNAAGRKLTSACERSLDRLKIDYLDLYLLHWRGEHPLTATIAGFESLRGAGRIRRWGVSNFDVDDLEDLMAVESSAGCAVNQVYYSVSARGIEFDLVEWQRQRHIPVMAYSPIDQGVAARDETLAAIGAERGATAAQIALAWVLWHPDVIAIPKAVRADHLRENSAAVDIALTPAELERIDRAFPPPKRKQPLEMI